MTDNQRLYDGIGRAAWGYLFIYFDFNINTVSIIPSFVGYLLFLSAVNYLEEDERELSLLRTPAIILTAWHVASWLASWAAIDLDGLLTVVDIIVGVVNIYFHFQLLTNLASIASRHQKEEELDRKLLGYRTLQTVMLTAVIILSYISNLLDGIAVFVSVCMTVVYLVAGILLMKVLFDLRRCFTCDNEAA